MTSKRSALRPFGILAGVVLMAAVPATAMATPSASPDVVRFDLPEPAGRYPVGMTELHLVDHARPDPWVPGSTRELMVSVRYPASHGGNPPASFMTPDVAEVEADEDAARLGVDPSSLDYAFATHSHVDTSVAGGGRRPVVLYSPGATQSRSFGTAQLEHLAAEGYVVVSIDHTHEAPAVEFPGGRVARGALPQPSPDVAERMLATRVRDTSFVLDQLTVLALGGNPDAEQRPLPAGLGRALDLSRVGMFGHSAGGFTAGETMVSDRRIDAGADLDGSMAYSQSARDFGRVAEEGLDRPFLLMGAGDHSAPSDPSWQEFLSNHRGWRLQLQLPTGEHFSYTDHQVLRPQVVTQLGLDPALLEPVIGTVDPGRSIAAQRAYLTAFFEQHLRHRPQRLLDGPSAQHPDVRFLG